MKNLILSAAIFVAFSANSLAHKGYDFGIKYKLIADHFWGITLPGSVLYNQGATKIYLFNGHTLGLNVRWHLKDNFGIETGADLHRRVLKHLHNQTSWDNNPLYVLEFPLKFNFSTVVNAREKRVFTIGGSLTYSGSTNGHDDTTFPFTQVPENRSRFEVYQNKRIIPAVLLAMGTEHSLGKYGSFYFGIGVSLQLNNGLNYVSKDYTNNAQDAIEFDTSYLSLDMNYILPWKIASKGKKIIMHKKRR